MLSRTGNNVFNFSSSTCAVVEENLSKTDRADQTGSFFHIPVIGDVLFKPIVTEVKPVRTQTISVIVHAIGMDRRELVCVYGEAPPRAYE